MSTTLNDNELRIWDTTRYFLAVFQRDEIIFIPVNQKRWNTYIFPIEIIQRMDLCPKSRWDMSKTPRNLPIG